MKKIFENHIVIRLGGNVERFHTERMLFRQSVAQHSFNAALLAYDIAQTLNDLVLDSDLFVSPKDVMLYMLMHDISEQAVGDIPSFTKKRHPVLSQMTSEAEKEFYDSKFVDTNFDLLDISGTEKLICKFCDVFECACTCIEEIAMGNSNFRAILSRCENSIDKLINDCSMKTLTNIFIELKGNLYEKSSNL